MEFTVSVQVFLKPGVLDAEGETITKSLTLLGYPIVHTESVKAYKITVEAASKDEAVKKVQDACVKLLANPVIQDFELKVL